MKYLRNFSFCLSIYVISISISAQNLTRSGILNFNSPKCDDDAISINLNLDMLAVVVQTGGGLQLSFNTKYEKKEEIELSFIWPNEDKVKLIGDFTSGRIYSSSCGNGTYKLSDATTFEAELELVIARYERNQKTRIDAKFNEIKTEIRLVEQKALNNQVIIEANLPQIMSDEYLGLKAQAEARVSAMRAKNGSNGYEYIESQHLLYAGAKLGSIFDGYGIMKFSSLGSGRWEGEVDLDLEQLNKENFLSYFASGYGVYYQTNASDWAIGFFGEGKMMSGAIVLSNGKHKYYNIGKKDDQSRYLGRYETDSGVYNGQFMEGTQNGIGIYKYSSGAEYVGEIENKAFNGLGFLKFHEGSNYTGQFMDGVPHGIGAFSLTNEGRNNVALWENGKSELYWITKNMEVYIIK